MKITIQVGEKEFSFTAEEAKEIFDQLGKVFPKEKEYIKEYVFPPQPVPATDWGWPWVKYSDTTATMVVPTITWVASDSKTRPEAQ